jgi:hypothetical protein
MRARSLFLAIALVLVIAPQAMAANVVSWNAGSPTTAAGKITGAGTYTVDAGYTVTSVQLNAVPTGGGMGYNQNGTAPAGGTWGSVQITGLPTGQYYVNAAINYKMGTMNTIYYSPLAIVNVP